MDSAHSQEEALLCLMLQWCLFVLAFLELRRKLRSYNEKQFPVLQYTCSRSVPLFLALPTFNYTQCGTQKIQLSKDKRIKDKDNKK